MIDRRSDPTAGFRLDGKVAIVTGASSGIGARFATTLAQSGALVIAAARRQDRLERLAGETSGIVPIRCDVRKENDRRAVVAAALDHGGRVDVLVNNAGAGGVFAAEDHVLEEFEESLALNLTSAFRLCQLAGARMLSTESGSIINVSSILGLVSAAPVSEAGYAAAKGALLSLTRELACQWGRRGVRVNALVPGWIRTEMTADLLADEASSRWVRRNTPMDRVGEVQELDGALLFLASGASSFMTGQSLVVDGGWTAR